MRRLAALAAVALTVAACSGDDDAGPNPIAAADSPDEAAGDTESTTTPTTTPITTSAPGSTTTAPSTTTSSTTTSSTTIVPPDPYAVTTSAGVAQGAPSAVDGVRNFLAIPYAEAPVDALAWAPPQPRSPWDEPLDATVPGASCPQTTEGITTAFLVTPDPEPDCLTLSVWSPDGAADLPVMVWFHGGGLSTGSAHEPYYIGDDLAAEGVVVVNVNYRLGAFGFLALPELQDESPSGAVGNYGLLDQTLALEWVQDNIESFGGDAGNVTIFGESAGGFSVCAHLAASGSSGLFHRAIVQSGGGCDRLLPLESAFEAGRALLDAIGCDDAACLRSADPDAIIAAWSGPSSLVRDGVVLPSSATELAAASGLAEVDVLIGSNADEATLFTLGVEEPDDAGLLDLANGLVADGSALVELYPGFDTNLEAYQMMSTDVSFTCPALAFAEAVPGAFAYHYTFVSESNPFGLGATHGAELALLFAHPEGLLVETQSTDRTRAMSDALQQAWVWFAATGDPGELFEPYGERGAVTVLDVPFEQVDEIREGRCAAVNELRAG